MANMRTVRKTVRFTGTRPDAPKPGAEKVEFLIDGEWVHKGWLMPNVIPCGDGYKYGGA